MNQEDVEAVVRDGETRTFRPLAELLDIPVMTADEAAKDMIRRMTEKKELEREA